MTHLRSTQKTFFNSLLIGDNKWHKVYPVFRIVNKKGGGNAIKKNCTHGNNYCKEEQNDRENYSVTVYMDLKVITSAVVYAVTR